MSDLQEEKKQKKKGGAAKVAVPVGAAAILLLLWQGPGLGLGSGFGLLPGTQNESATAESTAEAESSQEESGGQNTGADASTESGVITLRLEEERISANGTQIDSVEALENYLTQNHTDGTVYVLQDDYATEETYAAVRELLEALHLQYSEEKIN